MDTVDNLAKNAQPDFDRLASYSTKEQSKHGSKEEKQITDELLRDASAKAIGERNERNDNK